MGSFNTVCAVSHQIITPGEEVYLIPILNEVESRLVEYSINKENTRQISAMPSLVYNFDMYSPFGVMFEGTYEDYGQFSLKEDKANKVMLYFFKIGLSERLLDVKQGENEYHEAAFTKEMLNDDSKDTWETIQEGLRSKRILVKSSMFSYTQQPSYLNLMVVSKKNMDKLFKMWLEQTPTFYEYQGDKSFNTFFALDMKGRCNHYFTYLKELQENLKEDPLSVLSRYSERKLTYFLETGRENPSHISSMCIDNLFTEVTDLQKEPSENAVELFKLFHNLKNLVTIFQSLNIFPSPMWYSGQDYSNSSGFLYSIFMNEVYQDNLERADQQQEETDEGGFLTKEQLVIERRKIFMKDY